MYKVVKTGCLAGKNVVCKFKRGFTLIELLVVVLIIGILAAVAVPQYQKAVIKSRATEAVVIINNLRKAMAVYELTYGKLPQGTSVYFTGNNAVGDIDLPCKTKTNYACITSNGNRYEAFLYGEDPEDGMNDWGISGRIGDKIELGYSLSYNRGNRSENYACAMNSDVYVVQGKYEEGKALCKAIGKPWSDHISDVTF